MTAKTATTTTPKPATCNNPKLTLNAPLSGLRRAAPDENVSRVGPRHPAA
jgi:hypothetical protein